MADERRYAKTEKGADEIRARRNNLQGKLRMMLILVDPTKTADQLRLHAARLGVPPDFLETMVRESYIALAGPDTAATVGATARGANTASAGPDESARVRKAKTIMQQTLTAGMGQGASSLIARIEHCSGLSELAQLLPDYEKAIAKVSGDVEADVLADRLRKLLA